jgi:hypothetical protein
MATTNADNPDSLPAGAKWDDEVVASKYDADPDALPDGAKWDDDGPAPRDKSSAFHRALGVGELTATAVGNAIPAAANSAIDLGSRALGFGTGNNHVIPEFHAGQAAQDVVEDVKNSAVGQRVAGAARAADKWVGDNLGDTAQDVLHQAGSVAGDVANIVPVAKGLGALKDTAAAGSVAEAATTPMLAAQNNLQSRMLSSAQSMGAAASAPDLTGASPGTLAAIAKASNPNADAIVRHVRANKYGVQLMEGQATRDPVQYSAEQNSTDPHIAKRINDQNTQLTDALDGIRRDAAPTLVQNDHIENGQIAVDNLKAYDEPIKANIDSAYDAARQASAHGDLQMDGSGFVADANAALKPQSKFRFVPGQVKGILDDVDEAGGKMSLDDYQAYSTQLGNEIAKARAAGDGNAVAAISRVKDALERVQPASTETADAKALFDKARASAKARFDALDADPAYQAAVDDVSLNGVKRGKPSALADTFLDKYALRAPRANLALMMDKLDGDGRQAVAAHTLNAIRNKAVGKTGSVLPSGFSDAFSKYEPKLDLLVPSNTSDSLEELGSVINDAKVAPPGHSVNPSKSGVIINAASGTTKDLLGAALNVKTYGLGMPIVKGIAQRRFVNRSLAPGAGIDTPAPTPPVTGRASGGRVDHEALVNRLFTRWKQAQKESDRVTEPLLTLPDEAITKALRIAQSRATI